MSTSSQTVVTSLSDMSDGNESRLHPDLRKDITDGAALGSPVRLLAEALRSHSHNTWNFDDARPVCKYVALLVEGCLDHANAIGDAFHS